jgi:putrescine---pyruvate transaminase
MHVTSQNARELDAAYLLHGHANAGDRVNRKILVRGHGALVEDEEGRQYIDGISALWNVNLGYGRDELADAAAEQMRKLPFGSTYSSFANEPAIRLAARLEAIAYERLKATFFTVSGADANEGAFKTARYYWRRAGKASKVKILSLENGYHGLTMGAMSATGMPSFPRMFAPAIPGFLHVRAPYPYRCDFARPQETAGQAAARALQETIEREGADTIAAFIAEPVQGTGGVVVPPADYFPLVRQICDQFEVLFIADEVITGFGRTGKWFALSHWSVQPDIMTFAKGVTSGYLPLGGMMVAQEIADAISDAPSRDRWMHGSTYSGHPVCCAVALRVLEIMEQESLVEHAAEKGERLLKALEGLLDLEAVGEVRGLGMMAAVELVADRKTKARFPTAQGVGNEVRRRALEAGLNVRGPEDVIAIAPPFVITERQIDELVAILRGAILDTLRVRSPDG